MKNLYRSLLGAVLLVSTAGCVTQPTTHQPPTNPNSSSTSNPKNAKRSDSNWVYFASTDTHGFSMNKSSFHIDKNRGGKYAINIIVRSQDKYTDKVEFRREYVTAEDCGRGYGELVILTLSGEYETEVDYVKNGGTVASRAADILCEVVKSRLKKVEDDRKGI